MTGTGTASVEQADLDYVRTVRELCALGRCPDRATGYIERHTPESEILTDMIEHVFGRLPACLAAIRLAPWPDLIRQPDCDGAAPAAHDLAGQL